MIITGAEEPPAAPLILMVVVTECEEELEAAEKRMLVRRLVGEFKKFDIAPSFKSTVYEVPWALVAGCRQFRGREVKLSAPSPTPLPTPCRHHQKLR